MAEAETSPLHKHAHARFKEVFGPPDNTLGRDDHWGLKLGPHAANINVLINGTPKVPAVWVFDPHAKNDGVMRTGLHSEEDVEKVIELIQARVKNARAGN